MRGVPFASARWIERPGSCDRHLQGCKTRLCEMPYAEIYDSFHAYRSHRSQNRSAWRPFHGMSNPKSIVRAARFVGLNLAWTYALFLCGFGRRDLPVKAQEKAMQPRFKNLQVLKDVPPDQLIPAMQFITASLGVECEFCHVRDAFEKDDKQSKQTARRMIQMMFAINAN